MARQGLVVWDPGADEVRPPSGERIDGVFMSHKCDISGRSVQIGNRVSHANNKTRHVFKSNLQSKRLYVPSLKKFVRLRVSTRVIRTIDKLGFEEALKSHGLTVKDVAAR